MFRAEPVKYKQNMPAFTNEWLLQRLVLLVPLLFSLVIHEYAHARTALAYGDTTARDMGRVTLNPLAHLDPVGTLCLVLGGCIGWAKPVPVNPNNLEPPRLGDIAVSAAGPMSNLFVAVVTGFVIKGWFGLLQLPSMSFIPPEVWHFVVMILLYLLSANVCLFMFNLLPLFPLDGHHIARELLPLWKQEPFMRWQLNYGQKLLLGLIFVPWILRTAMPQVYSINPLLSVVLDPIAALSNFVTSTAMSLLVFNVG